MIAASHTLGNREALQAIEAALAAASRARDHNLEAGRAAEEALGSLDGYEPAVRAIEFDRPDRDVSEHGRSLRSKSQASVAQAAEGGRCGGETVEEVGRLDEAVGEALAAVDSHEYRARQHLQEAARDLIFLTRYTLPGLTEGFALSQETLGGGLDPYLAEVEEDAPGRDVGRFADKIGARFQLGGDQLKHSQVSVRLTDEDLEGVGSSLDQARQELLD